jgi:hypothetical protein
MNAAPSCAATARRELKEAESRIDRITKAADGSLTTQTVETI